MKRPIVVILLLTLVACAQVPAETPVPGGNISGRIYLMDRDEPVRTIVELTQDEDPSEKISLVTVDSTETDVDGYYYFLVEEPGTYHITVSILDLYNICDNLKEASGSGWPKEIYTTDDAGVIVDDKLVSEPIDITIDDKIALDCELYCD